MNKAELIASIAEHADITKTDAAKAVRAFCECVEEAFRNKDKVQLIGFGTFEVRSRKARTGHNPQTGDEIAIPASAAPVFKASKVLKDSVNK